jgi:zinc transport system ATP-binding protein
MIPLPLDVPPLVSIRGLRVVRGSKVVLDGVNLEVARGRITAILGLNGSGKSTLLRTLLGEWPYQGAIEYHCGHDHSKPRPESIGYVPQRLNFEAHLPLTVRDLLGLALNGTRPILFGFRKGLERRMRECLKTVQAEDILDIPVEGLSGGQLQRVLLALAMEPHPELLLLDEPATGIDFQTEREFYRLIASICDSTGVTVLLVSHDLDAVREFSHHVVCLRDGRVQLGGLPAEILTPANLAAAFGTRSIGL